jgi:hypothetical protein
VQEIKRDLPPEIQENLINQYSYKADEITIEKQKTEKEKENKSEDYFRAIAQKEQSARKKTFGFYELHLQCEERLINFLWGPQELKFKRIYELEKECINKKLEVLAEYKKEVSFDGFQDTLYYYKGEVLIPEVYLPLPGFLREYLQLEKVVVLYDTGELLLIKTQYCNFWFKDRLQNIANHKLSLTKPEIIDEDSCLDCIYNWNCPFARIQQMSN